MKKTLYCFLMLGLVLIAVFASPLHILAAEDGNTVLTMEGRENTETQEIEIDVTVEENTGVCGMLLSLEYDTSVFTLTDLEFGTACSSLYPMHTNAETEQGYSIYPFKITYLGEKNDTSTGHMMTLRFGVKEDAPGGIYTIALRYEKNQDVTYLKDHKIKTKNLLIDSAKITLSGNKITNIDTVPSDQGELNYLNVLWLPIIIGGMVLISSGFLLVSLLIKRKKPKKWKRI